jgi:hypothetical protein
VTVKLTETLLGSPSAVRNTEVQMQTAKLIGAAGVGKTSEILRIMTLALGSPEVAGDPTRLGFTTLTRIGRAEAATRAARDWGVPVGYLEKEGHFKTTHSIAFRARSLAGETKTNKRGSRSDWGSGLPPRSTTTALLSSRVTETARAR